MNPNAETVTVRLTLLPGWVAAYIPRDRDGRPGPPVVRLEPDELRGMKIEDQAAAAEVLAAMREALRQLGGADTWPDKKKDGG